jgi:hypothetical protein
MSGSAKAAADEESLEVSTCGGLPVNGMRDKTQLPTRRRSRAGGLALDMTVFALWTALFLFLASRHVPWRDEYQSWLVATRTHTVSEFFRAVNYERSPPLQYVLQRGFYEYCRLLKSFLPLPDFNRTVYFRAVSYAFSIGTTLLLVFGFGLPRKLKWLLPFSFILLLDWGIVSRSYAIGTFFSLASVWWFRRRRIGWSCLSLALASMTHFYFTLLASSLLLLQAWRLFRVRKFLQTRRLRRHVLPIALAGASILLSVWLQLPPKDSPFPVVLNWDLHPLSFGARNLVQGMTLLDGFRGPFHYDGSPFGVRSAWVFLGLFALGSWRDRFPVLDFAVLAAGPFLMISSMASAALRYLAIFFLAALVAFLMGRSAREGRHRTGVGVMTVLAFLGAWASFRWLHDWKPYLPVPSYDWSGSEELHQRLGPDLADPRALIVTEADWLFFPTMLLENKSILLVRRDEVLSYPEFRASSRDRSLDQWCRDPRSYSAARFAGLKLYFGTPAGSKLPESCGKMKLVFETKRPVRTDETYAIYVPD